MSAVKSKRRVSPGAAIFTIWTLLFVLTPLCYVLGVSFMENAGSWGVNATFTLASYQKLLDPIYLNVFGQSLWLALLTTLLTLLIGYPFAYFTSKLSAKRRGTVMLLVMVPFWTNSLVRIYGWIILLRSQGVINNALMSLGIIDKPLKLLYNFGAVLVGMVYALIPFMILTVYNSISKLDPALIEASRDLGASGARAFWTVTVPMTRGGILAGCVLVFIPSVGLFFISDLLGGAKTMLLGNLIKNELLTAHNFPLSAALSIVMLIMTLLMIFLYQRCTGARGLEGIV